MQITPILFEAYLKCTTKCYLRSLGESGAGDSFSEWMKAQNESYRKNWVEQLTFDIAPEEYAFGPSAAECLRHTKWKFAVDVVADAKNMNSTIHAVERLPSIGQGHPAQFIPKRFISTNKLTRNDKLLMAFDALVLSETIGRGVKFGKIVHGDNHATLKVDAYALAKETRKLVEKIATVISVSSPPELILNPHCAECEFQSQCRQHAIEKDDLSLLSSMTEKERRKFNSKGIFTVTQLSYTFRPRRRPKRLREKREKYHHALKALAIRQKKIHIVGQPHLKIEGTLVYLDVEGLPDRDFYYLIGVRIKTNQSVVERSFWASDAEEEREIWISFLKILAEIENPVLIHYGSFETTFFRRMLERYGEPLDGSGAASTIKSALNLISLLFAQVYFPTYSNRLKDLAGSLGFRWSSANPSGIQSIIWRTKWEQTGDSSAKQSLITYNLEDCQALEVLTQTLLHFLNPDAQHDLSDGATPEIAAVESLISRDGLWRRFSSPIADFEVINKAARWDFQRDRIYIRTDKKLAHSTSKKRAGNKKVLPINKIVKCKELTACPICNRAPDKQYRPRTLVLYDLRFSKSGIKRWVVKYRFCYYRCDFCQMHFGRPEAFWPHSEFGRNVVVFVVYNMIELCVPQMTTTAMLSRLFGLGIANSVVNSFKGSAADYYRETRQKILANMINGQLIHADETPIALRDRHGYVWVFTSMHEVVYFYTETRDSDLLHENLKEFKGVLVSDFYTAYDSLSCPQQKCLLHLMRDLNEAILNYPFDEELRRLALGFGDLLRGIVKTIDRWGLKRRFLSKHLVEVDRFYRETVKADYQSEAALKCKERFEKNRDRLFTFLNYDGVPWNNNNAEHAIKAFARIRRIMQGLSTPKATDDYLILLSVCQTCKYSGLDFMDFLRSEKKDIDAFARG